MLSNIQSKSISTIRCIAILMIIACHVLQGYNIIFAFWLNVGVQIFLFMSAFLYGSKTISNFITWLILRLIKILVPFYILVSIYLAYYHFVGHFIVSYKIIIKYLFSLQGLFGGAPGLDHLWFLTAILICYALVPIFQSIANKIDNCPLYTWIFVIIGMFFIAQVFFFKIKPEFGAWISIYVFGYFLSRRYNNVIPKKLVWTLTIFVLILMPARIYLQYFFTTQDVVFNTIFSEFIIPWTHGLLGIWLFILLYNCFQALYSIHDNSCFMPLIKWIDKYSYNIYLTHHVFILSPFSLLFLTPFKVVNIITMLALTVLASVILQKTSLYFENSITKRQYSLD